MTLMTQEQFTDFFKPYAGDVEGFYQARYWSLSDAVIQELIRLHLGTRPGEHVLDAGGGTGRWALWLNSDQNVSVTVADKSPEMLAQAAANVSEAGNQKVRLHECDLQNGIGLNDNEFDAVLSTYGVLSFLDNPDDFFATIYRVLKPGATALMMSHSLANALSTKLSRDIATPDALTKLAQDQIVKWSPSVPPLRVYSAQDLTDLARNAGFNTEAVFGVTTLLMPGPEDFGYPYTEISKVSQALEDPDFFRAALALELEASQRADWAERGVNLMIKIRKPSTES